MDAYRIILVLITLLCLRNAYATTETAVNNLSLQTEHEAQFNVDRRSENNGVITLEIRRLLSEGDFEQLNRVLERLRVNAATDLQTEQVLLSAYGAFEGGEAYEPLIDSWIEQYPANYQPYTARAYFYYRLGWAARGTSWASETKDEQLEEMRRYFGQASADVSTALTLDANTIIPYYILIGITSTQVAIEERDAVLQKALKVNPASYILRDRYLKFRTPRWGGSYKEMEDFINESMRYASSNPNLQMLAGLPYADAADMQEIIKKRTVADELYTKALTFGENHEILMKRARNRKKMKDYEAALADIERALELYADDEEYYYHRADIYTELGKNEKAIPDIEMAYLLAPNKEYILKFIDWFSSRLISEAYELKNSKQYSLALNYLNTVVHLKPSDAEGYYWRSRILIDQNKREQALQDLVAAINLEKGKIEYYLLIDWLLTKSSEWGRVIEYWNEFIAHNPDNGRAYVERGGAYFRKGDIEAAVADAKISADMGNPEGLEAYEKYKYLVTPQGKVIHYVRSVFSQQLTLNLLLAALGLLVLLWVVKKISSRREAR